ncbi:hypothetical protein JZO70_14150 [Enterococcus sp. 669A]|uniref:Uncharacterized protein n=1 Tax=Candidatus Enterococcus moelleringii TaxID=2815325 RepID=A0ABS3LCF6_9ENTE|nr:hypothetical protein [Enterococcus sp. 669A]MBO1307316.1 hypothetical protein [Enterococcus sp. 669A]
MTSYSPLAASHLAKSETVTSKHLETDKIARQKYAEMESKDLLIIERIGELAE